VHEGVCISRRILRIASRWRCGSGRRRGSQNGNLTPLVSQISVDYDVIRTSQAINSAFRHNHEHKKFCTFVESIKPEVDHVEDGAIGRYIGQHRKEIRISNKCWTFARTDDPGAHRVGTKSIALTGRGGGGGAVGGGTDGRWGSMSIFRWEIGTRQFSKLCLTSSTFKFWKWWEKCNLF